MSHFNKEFKEIQRKNQINWRKKYLPNINGNGLQNGKSYPHILPKEYKQFNFYLTIKEELFHPVKGYLKKNNVKPHSGIHNLLSSWVACANIYWPFNNPEGKALLAVFLRKETSLDIQTIEHIDLEYEEQEYEDLKPGKLLGEDKGGMRGSGQTSPDLAIRFRTSKNEKGILLIESKFTERSFYVCSGYSKQNKLVRTSNPDNKRCFNTKNILAGDFKDCHLNTWGRKYWSLLKNDIDKQKYLSLKKCPMSTSCYQLFRQQALAKGFEKHYKVVASCVATDARNDILIKCGNSAGLQPFPNGWKELFPKLPFYWFTHNNWFEYVKYNNSKGLWDTWLEYVGNRYFK